MFLGHLNHRSDIIRLLDIPPNFYSFKNICYKSPSRLLILMFFGTPCIKQVYPIDIIYLNKIFCIAYKQANFKSDMSSYCTTACNDCRSTYQDKNIFLIFKEPMELLQNPFINDCMHLWFFLWIRNVDCNLKLFVR